MVVGINAGIVAVAPIDADGVVAHRFHTQHLQRGLEHLKRIVRLRRSFAFGRSGRGTVGAGARGAGALVAQVRQPVLAMVGVLPVDLDSLGFGNRDVFRVGGKRHGRFNACQLKRRSTSRTPEMRRMADTSFSSCFLSLTSTVISTIPPPWSDSVLASRLRMLVFSSESTEVSRLSMPGRSSVWMTIRTGKASSAARAHSTSILRSTSYNRLCTLGHTLEWTATPLPRVI